MNKLLTTLAIALAALSLNAQQNKLETRNAAPLQIKGGEPKITIKTNQAKNTEDEYCSLGMELPWSDDFSNAESGEFPECWTVHKTPEDPGDTVNWMTVPGITGGGMYILTVTGTQFAFIPSGNLRHNAWLVSPGLLMEEGKTYRIEFPLFMKGNGSQYDELTVKIANANDTASLNAGTQIFQSLDKDWKAWTNVLVEYTATTSGKHYIGFHSTGLPSVGAMGIERIDVTPLENYIENDLVIKAPFPYTQVPRTQFPFVATATNLGSVEQPNVKLSATVNLIDAGTSEIIPSVGTGKTSEQMSITPTIGIEPGPKTVRLTVTSDLLNQGNKNTTEIFYTATENEYAQEADIHKDIVGNNAPASFGNVFKITQTTSLTQIKVNFPDIIDANQNSLYRSAKYSISLYRMNAQGTHVEGEPLFTTEEYQKPEIAPNWMSQDVPVTVLEPGDYYLCINQTTTTNLGLAVDGSANKTGYIIYGRQFVDFKTAMGGSNTRCGVALLRMVVSDENVPIKVSSTTPVKDATNVAIDQELKVTFNQRVSLITARNITITPTLDDYLVTVKDWTLNIEHTNFEKETTYTVTIPVGSIENYDEEITWSFTTGSHAAVADKIEQDALVVYPNPVNDELRITNYELGMEGAIEIYDMNGKRVGANLRVRPIDNCQFSINVSHLPAGTYIVKIGNRSTKIVKK